ncbi:hypothetical protein EOA85_04195 [Mesorhizobium sp. M5C.F.Ca.IN.020.29.1.1]|uniref:hypothetical protein n=1 Tax=unclassified Mesorhizobium TaxID=325217 RepID=UPI000FCA18DB|nr:MULTISPECIES: hypothetical protein [unclassified Mesorhizobium]RUV63128.1 hypothetical protein EOA85_04195 [Mesorhizobium sp. M5C.F.Ca.IN.020.29.1.1]TIM90208.1 MAG: hypothetical protein E5Y50_03145 [Mesorhizobium sp.]
MTRFLTTENISIVGCYEQVQSNVEANLLHDGVVNTLASVSAARVPQASGMVDTFGLVSREQCFVAEPRNPRVAVRWSAGQGMN